MKDAASVPLILCARRGGAVTSLGAAKCFDDMVCKENLKVGEVRE